MTRVEVLVDLAFCLAEFVFGLAVEFAGRNFMIGCEVDRVTQAIGRGEFLWKFGRKQRGEMRQGFCFDVFGKLRGVCVEGVDMRVKVIKRTENTEEELGMGRSRVAHEFDSGDNRG